MTLLFTLHWFLKARFADVGQPIGPSWGLGGLAGLIAGFTTFIAHAGGPPIIMYLLKRGMEKGLFAGTMALFFLIANVLKLPIFGALMARAPETAMAALVLAPVVPVGVALGKIIHDRSTGRGSPSGAMCCCC